MTTQMTLPEMLNALTGSAKSPDIKEQVITTDHWAPFYNQGDAMLLHLNVKLNLGDHVQVIASNGTCYVGALQELTNSKFVIRNLTARGSLSLFKASQISEIWKVASVMKR